MSGATSANDVPTHWYNILGDLPFELLPDLTAPVREMTEPVRPQLPLALVRQSVSVARHIEISRRCQRTIPDLAAYSSCPSYSVGAGARNPGADLLQIRRKPPMRSMAPSKRPLARKAMAPRPCAVLSKRSRVVRHVCLQRIPQWAAPGHGGERRRELRLSQGATCGLTAR